MELKVSGLEQNGALRFKDGAHMPFLKFRSSSYNSVKRLGAVGRSHNSWRSLALQNLFRRLSMSWRLRHFCLCESPCFARNEATLAERIPQRNKPPRIRNANFGIKVVSLDSEKFSILNAEKLCPSFHHQNSSPRLLLAGSADYRFRTASIAAPSIPKAS